MYLQRLILQNIRGIRDLDFDFQRMDGSFAGWSVIAGANGSGKSALLRSLAMALIGPDATRALQPSLSGWITNGEPQGVISAKIMPSSDHDRFGQGKPNTKPFEAVLEFIKEGEAPEPVLRSIPQKQLGPTRGPWSANPQGWFCVGYGPFRRLYGHSAEAQRIMSTMGRVARFATMFREDATLSEGEIWMRELQHRTLEGDRSARELLAQVIQLVNQDLLANGVTIERVDHRGIWLRQSDGLELPLSDMSDGYRAALAMTVDIVRQVSIVFGTHEITEERSDAMDLPIERKPHVDGRGSRRMDHENASENKRLVVPYPGIVLIDEIDAHLHPDWQRVIGFWLKTIFPKMQFIVTTHSAYICQAADSNGLFFLPPPGFDKPPFRLSEVDYYEVIRGKPDEIYLTPMFGMRHTRSPRAVQARLDFSKLRAKQTAYKLTPKEKDQMQQLMLFMDLDELNSTDNGHSDAPTSRRASKHVG